MIDLNKPWPLGLCRHRLCDFVIGLGFVLFILVFFDVFVSDELQSVPNKWRAPFALVTGFGLVEWILVPPLLAILLCLICYAFVPAGLWRRAVLELGQLSSFIIVGVGLPGLLANLLKRVIGRARPMEFAEAGVFRFHTFFNDWNYQSFPSGHSTTAIATAFVIGFLSPRFFTLLLLIALTTGISRVVIGMHYPTDVVAGFVVGTLGAYGVRNFYAYRHWLFARQPDGAIHFIGVPALCQAWRQLGQRARA